MTDDKRFRRAELEVLIERCTTVLRAAKLLLVDIPTPPAVQRIDRIEGELNRPLDEWVKLI